MEFTVWRRGDRGRGEGGQTRAINERVRGHAANAMSI